MTHRRHSFGLVGTLGLLTVLVAGTIGFSIWFTREPPNYTKIEPGLWLGGQVDSPPPGCTAVLNLNLVADPYVAESHHWSPIRDAEPAPDLAWLSEQVATVEAEGAAGRSLYVHCQNGVSRSAMVVMAYLMKRDGLSVDQALAVLRQHRPQVRPNPAFGQLLRQWQQKLGE